MKYDYGSDSHLKISLLDETIVYRESGFDLRVSVANKTDTVFLLYDFRNVEDGGNSKSWYMQPDRPMGSVIFIRDLRKKWVKMELEGLLQRYDLQNTPVPLDSVEANIVRNTIVLPAKGTLECTIHVKLAKNNLGEVRSMIRKGKYELSFMYYCGYNISFSLEEGRIKEDERKHNAVTFQGYAESKAVKLIVE